MVVPLIGVVPLFLIIRLLAVVPIIIPPTIGIVIGTLVVGVIGRIGMGTRSRGLVEFLQDQIKFVIDPLLETFQLLIHSGLNRLKLILNEDWLMGDLLGTRSWGHGEFLLHLPYLPKEIVIV